jgi:hypothetical protein
MMLAGESRASDHRAHTLVTAHRVNSDTRRTHGCLPPALRARLRLKTNRNDLATVVVAARGAQVVRALQFAAVRAFMEGLDAQRVMAATHAPAGGEVFLLGTAMEAPVPENYVADDKSRPNASKHRRSEGAPIANLACVASISGLVRA